MSEQADRDALAVAMARVAREHPIECTSAYEGYTCRGCRERGWMAPAEYRRHVADAQAAVIASDWLAQRDRRVAADALREAAEEAEASANNYRWAKYVARWLRERADRIEAGQ